MEVAGGAVVLILLLVVIQHASTYGRRGRRWGMTRQDRRAQDGGPGPRFSL